MKWQLVQFLLKQAGVDKRTGDLYGNRDLLNIARNMARGLKVLSEKPDAHSSSSETTYSCL